MIKLLLDRGASIDCTDSEGWTPLMVAAYNGYEKAVRILLEHGASVDARTDNGHTVYSLARMCILALLQSPVSTDGTSPDQESTDLTTESVLDPVDRPTSARCETSASPTPEWALLEKRLQVEMMQLRLLQTGISANHITSRGEHLMTRAVRNQHTRIVQLLIEYGATLDFDDYEDTICFSFLMVAAHVGNAEITRLLLEGGALVNAQLKNGENALFIAAWKGHQSVVEVLIRNGADVNLTVSKPNKPEWTAIMYAAKQGYGDAVKFLIAAGAVVDPDEDFYYNSNDTPLTCTAKGGHEQVVRMLIDHGVDVNATTVYCEPFLVSAIKRGRENVARILIGSGSNLDQHDFDGCTPLMRAAEKGSEELVRMLLQRGASIECKAIGNCETVLMLADTKSVFDCCSKLELPWTSRRDLKARLHSC